jgi:hypothetical protein
MCSSTVADTCQLIYPAVYTLHFPRRLCKPLDKQELHNLYVDVQYNKNEDIFLMAKLYYEKKTSVPMFITYLKHKGIPMDNFPPVILEEMEGVLSILLLIGFDPLVHRGNSCITLYTHALQFDTTPLCFR